RPGAGSPADPGFLDRPDPDLVRSPPNRPDDLRRESLFKRSVEEETSSRRRCGAADPGSEGLMFEGDNKREKILVLLTMCFALFMAMLDNTVVNVALPKLAQSLHAGISGLQWGVDGYVLAFASLMLTGGILGCRYG